MGVCFLSISLKLVLYRSFIYLYEALAPYSRPKTLNPRLIKSISLKFPFFIPKVRSSGCSNGTRERFLNSSFFRTISTRSPLIVVAVALPLFTASRHSSIESNSRKSESGNFPFRYAACM